MADWESSARDAQSEANRLQERFAVVRDLKVRDFVVVSQYEIEADDRAHVPESFEVCEWFNPEPQSKAQKLLAEFTKAMQEEMAGNHIDVTVSARDIAYTLFLAYPVNEGLNGIGEMFHDWSLKAQSRNVNIAGVWKTLAEGLESIAKTFEVEVEQVEETDRQARFDKNVEEVGGFPAG